MTAITLANRANRNRNGVDIANSERKKVKVYFTSKSVRIKKVEKMEKN